MKNLFKKDPSQNASKGMPSAVILSILIHTGLFLLAGMLVVFTVVRKDEQNFEPPKAVERPKMKLKKPKVKLKQSSKPKSTTRIVTRDNRASMPDIQLPEMSGMGDALGDGFGDGLGMMLDPGEITLFGSGQTIGNDFVGTLYNLNRRRDGTLVTMDGDMFRQKLRDFVLSGWNTAAFNAYYRLPNQLYTTHFMIPEVPSPMAPDVFGAPDMEGYFFMIHYKGKLVSQEPITFRFWGIGDAYIMVNVDGREVLLNCWVGHQPYFDWWESTSSDHKQYILGNQPVAVGDWITLEPGKPLDMQVMFGEYVGGALAAMLNVEVQGVEYERNKQGAPILPAFKTAEFSLDLIDEIYPHLYENETCLTNGPVFSDYSVPKAVLNKAGAPLSIEPPPASVSASRIRTWVLADGRTIKAELLTMLGNKVSLKGPRGKIIRIEKDMFSEEDLTYIQLENPPIFDISFSKQSEQRNYPDPLPTAYTYRQPSPTATRYVFSTTVKQISPGSYDQELQVEFFAVGAEINGNRYILLDRQKTLFSPTRENNRSVRLSGNTVELPDFMIGTHEAGWDRRGKKYASFLVVIRDSRGKIIAHETPKKWLFENLENLEKVPVGKYFDKTGTRVRPTRPKTNYY